MEVPNDSVTIIPVKISVAGGQLTTAVINRIYKYATFYFHTPLGALNMLPTSPNYEITEFERDTQTQGCAGRRPSICPSVAHLRIDLIDPSVDGACANRAGWPVRVCASLTRTILNDGQNSIFTY